MRFELNFAAVVRNVAVRANVAILAVDRFVAVVHSVVHHLSGYGPTQATGPMRLQSWCDSCPCSSADRMAAEGYAMVAISPQREITRRWQQRLLLSKRRG